MRAEPATATAVHDPDATPPALLEVEGLTKYFDAGGGLFGRGARQVRAVDGVSFSLRRGATLGLVGESGSGKSTTARLVLRLLEPSSGRVSFDGVDVTTCTRREMARLRRRMQVVFQDPYGSLDPRMNALAAIGEPLVVHRMARGRDLRVRVAELLERVGLRPADMWKYPHQFSGGQAQRVSIARALATDPELIICDEAVSALDASIQAQILNLLRRLQSELGLSYLFIAHDLNVVRYMSDELCVMYMGRIVERGDADRVLRDPVHPYTRMLVAAIPSLERPGGGRCGRPVLRGEVSSPLDPPSGCRFHPRCPDAVERCRHEDPAPRPVAVGRIAACHLHPAGPDEPHPDEPQTDEPHTDEEVAS
ncbi:MAG: ABC transporter ATP-binding protein [Actinomycetota bacterium]|nr:ABC transporter ATP-binding protein [Actinomycetota bacterium]